jgi:hypothetical protein
MGRVLLIERTQGLGQPAEVVFRRGDNLDLEGHSTEIPFSREPALNDDMFIEQNRNLVEVGETRDAGDPQMACIL